mmetsp:Transcript_25159/g.75762  ORF Transcript_25159/g.75762 Transcript_25159/m.75762 type:complete len:95 (+) Transcript_25159:2225-2509(+)
MLRQAAPLIVDGMHSKLAPDRLPPPRHGALPEVVSTAATEHSGQQLWPTRTRQDAPPEADNSTPTEMTKYRVASGPRAGSPLAFLQSYMRHQSS